MVEATAQALLSGRRHQSEGFGPRGAGSERESDMEVEVLEVVDFLAAHSPFRELPAPQRSACAAAMTVRYFRRGTTILEVGQPNDRLYLVRSGAVDLFDEHGILIDRNGQGETFGSLPLMSGGETPYRVRALEDTLTLTLPADHFRRLFDEEAVIRDYFTPRQRGRLKRATESLQEYRDPILRLTASDLISRAPVTAPPTLSVREAAQLMTDQRVSALLLVHDDGTLAGIVTDRDLRSRVVATGASVEQPISAVMTGSPTTVTAEVRAFELLMTMTSKRIHHLPVLADHKPLGLVSAGDLMRLETSNPVFLVSDIAKQSSVAGLAEVVGRAPRLARQLLGQGASADDAARVLTAVVDAATVQLIRLAVAELGPAPGGWCWVALGSQARRELALGSDQDHAIIVADDVQLDWYRQLAERVVAGLEEAGYHRCPGEAMATKWCYPLEEWVAQFSQWLDAPKPEAILHTQIFFDMRALHGDAELLARLRATVLPRAQQAPRFLAHLAAMAVRREPPLGFFRGFVVDRLGEHANELDLKSGGLHAIIELARVLSLAAGISDVGTVERIAALSAAGKISSDEATDLLDAFEFLSSLRLKHQVDTQTLDNHINPDELTASARRHLRAAFGVIRSAQRTLSYQFQTHRMN